MLFHVHPWTGCFLIALRISKPRIPFGYYSIVLRPLFSHPFPSPSIYLLPHTPNLAGEVTTRELSRELISFWTFLQIWTEEKRRVGILGRKAQAACSVCGSLIQRQHSLHRPLNSLTSWTSSFSAGHGGWPAPQAADAVYTGRPCKVMAGKRGPVRKPTSEKNASQYLSLLSRHHEKESKL